MFPYLSVLLLSYLLLKLCDGRVGSSRLIFEILGILPITILAGCRDFTIGTDTAGYPTEMFYLCRSCNSLTEALVMVAGEVEPLYVVLQYVVSRFFSDAHWVLFFSHVIMYFNIVYACRKLKISPSICVFVYFCTFFDFSLNGARQSIALSFIPLSFYFLAHEKYVKTIFFLLIAYFIHGSTLICAIIFVLYWLVDKKPSYFATRTQKVMVISAVTIMLFSFASIIAALGDYGIIRSEYTDRYASADEYGSNLPISNIFINAVNLFVYYKVGGKKKGDSLSIFMEYIVLLSLILCFSALISTYLVRITFNFVTLAMCYCAGLMEHSKSYHKKLSYFLYFFYWFVITYINLEDIMPYTSKLLGI